MGGMYKTMGVKNQRFYYQEVLIVNGISPILQAKVSGVFTSTTHNQTLTCPGVITYQRQP